MSPKQCDHNPTSATENDLPAMSGVGGGPLEMMLFTVNQMYEHAMLVNELESIAMIKSISGVRVRRLQWKLLDSLVVLAHIAHRFLLHGDRAVRAAAELLTTGTAFLIGRLYNLTRAGPPMTM